MITKKDNHRLNSNNTNHKNSFKKEIEYTKKKSTLVIEVPVKEKVPVEVPIELAPENENENYIKGIKFEKYIISLFNERYFSIYDCTRDNSKKLGVRVESDSNPDITMRYKNTDELFSIECKFRSQLYNNAIQWARTDQIINYLTYEFENDIPTFVVIGLGGTPNRPERMFCLPIKKAKYTELFLSTLEKHERPPDKMFFWKNRILK